MSKTKVWETSVALRFRDFDYLGHMTATSYLAFVEEARVEWMGMIQSDTRPSYVVAEQCIVFHEETLPSQSPLRIVISVSIKGQRSLEVEEHLYGDDGRLKATSKAILVAWDKENRKSREFTKEEKKLLTKK